MPWINNLKIAIIEEDIPSISKLSDELPKFDNLDKAQEALSLIQVAIKLVRNEKQETLATINKIKKTKEFLST